MIKSAITVSLVAQAKGGPFVYWDGLESAAASAAKLGFDAIEVFAPSAASIDRPALHALLKQHSLAAAAFGTGGGWLIHKWHLTHADPTIRQQAREFIRAIIAAGEVILTIDGKISRLAIDQGFVRVVSDKVSVVTEAAIDESKIDLKAVENAEARAREAVEAARGQKDIDPVEIAKMEQILRFALVQRLVKGRTSQGMTE